MSFSSVFLNGSSKFPRASVSMNRIKQGEHRFCSCYNLSQLHASCLGVFWFDFVHQCLPLLQHSRCQKCPLALSSSKSPLCNSQTEYDKKVNQSVNIDVPIVEYLTRVLRFVIFAIVYDDDHINYIVTVLRSKLHIKE